MAAHNCVAALWSHVRVVVFVFAWQIPPANSLCCSNRHTHNSSDTQARRGCVFNFRLKPPQQWRVPNWPTLNWHPRAGFALTPRTLVWTDKLVEQIVVRVLSLFFAFAVGHSGTRAIQDHYVQLLQGSTRYHCGVRRHRSGKTSHTRKGAGGTWEWRFSWMILRAFRSLTCWSNAMELVKWSRDAAPRRWWGPLFIHWRQCCRSRPWFSLNASFTVAPPQMPQTKDQSQPPPHTHKCHVPPLPWHATCHRCAKPPPIPPNVTPSAALRQHRSE